MTDIIRAKNSGFCFGVRQAIEKTEEQIEKNKDGRRIYIWAAYTQQTGYGWTQG